MLPGMVPDDKGGGPVIEIDGCAKCGATWFDGGELERIAAKQIVDLYSGDPAAASRCWKCGEVVGTSRAPGVGPASCAHCQARLGRSCPACSARMGVLEHAGVLVDVCGKCHGIFLDRGEFDLILALPGDPLACVRCGSTTFEPRHSYFGERGLLCGPCHAEEKALAAGAGAGEAARPAVKKIDVTRFLAEYLRLRSDAPLER